MSVKTACSVLCVVVASLAFAAGNGPQNGGPGKGVPRTDGRGPGASVERRGPSAVRGPRAGEARGRREAVPGQALRSEAENRLIESIEEADSMDLLMRHYPIARASRCADVRRAMVSALEDQGARGLKALVPFIGDPDEDVADDAFSAWTSILQDMPARRRLMAIQTSISP